ncbi:MAG TPA: hypothetical protein VMD79_08180 [Solirubrobacteraceae bacterium]|nr:hypothetical protein [Solirubrobacteraceae bacterium]
MSPPPQESKAANRLITLGVIVAFAFGLVVPALVLAHNGEDAGSEAVGVHLTANQTKGRELFAHTCNVCHTLAAVKSVGRIGPDLDVLVPTIGGYEERKAFVLSTILEGPALGKGNMPGDLFVGKEAEDVAEFVAAVAGHH